MVPHNVLLHIERTADSEFRLVRRGAIASRVRWAVAADVVAVQAVVNTSQHNGLEYHPRRAFLSPPKIKCVRLSVSVRLFAS